MTCEDESEEENITTRILRIGLNVVFGLGLRIALNVGGKLNECVSMGLLWIWCS